MTRVPELMAAGVDVAFGHDCVMDPWYSLGSGDMLEVAHMGLHVAQMTSADAHARCVRRRHRRRRRGFWASKDTASTLGCNADCVLLQARDPVEAIRLRAGRTAVIRRGKVVSRAPAMRASLSLEGRPQEVNFRLER